MSVKKLVTTSSTQYGFSLSQSDFERNGKNYLGKIVSNFAGTKINLFSKGANVNKQKPLPETRLRLAYIDLVFLKDTKNFDKCFQTYFGFFAKRKKSQFSRPIEFDG